MKQKTFSSKLSEATNSLNNRVIFVNAYAKDSHGHPYCEVTSNNFMQILTGANLWGQFTDDQRMIINGILLAGEGRRYDELLQEAVKLKAKTDDFIQTYLTDCGKESFHEVTAENYEQILSGKREWNMMPDDMKIITNVVLSMFHHHNYEDFLCEAESLKNTVESFLQSYACDESGVLYHKVTLQNYQKVLSAQNVWKQLDQRQKNSINLVWEQTSFDQLLNMAQMLESSSQSFVKVYISQRDGTLYHEATIHNYEQILSGWNFWKKLSKDQRTLIDELLEREDVKIYEDLVMDAREFDHMVKEFIRCYIHEEQEGEWLGVNAGNYARIMAGESVWEKLYLDEQDAVNKALLPQYGCGYESILKQAKDFQKNVIDFIQTYKQKESGELSKEQVVFQNMMKEQATIGSVDLKAMEEDMQKQIQQARRTHQTTNTHGSVQEEQKPIVKPAKQDNKAYKGPVAVCGMLSVAAIALLGKKKKK